jgi:hypothetical protein
MLLLIRACAHFALKSATNLNPTSLERSVGKVALAIGIAVTSSAFGGDE